MTDFNTDPDYEECLVTFFDVLGFRNLLNTRSGAEIRELLTTFRHTSPGDATAPTRSDEMRMVSEVHAEIVSDAIVRVRTTETQYHAGALVWELIDLLHIQIECISSGILMRGAMTIGHMHLGISFDGPVFGPGWPLGGAAKLHLQRHEREVRGSARVIAPTERKIKFNDYLYLAC